MKGKIIIIIVIIEVSAHNYYLRKAENLKRHFYGIEVVYFFFSFFLSGQSFACKRSDNSCGAEKSNESYIRT